MMHSIPAATGRQSGVKIRLRYKRADQQKAEEYRQ
jgi:hypothetical protein